MWPHFPFLKLKEFQDWTLQVDRRFALIVGKTGRVRLNVDNTSFVFTDEARYPIDPDRVSKEFVRIRNGLA